MKKLIVKFTILFAVWAVISLFIYRAVQAACVSPNYFVIDYNGQSIGSVVTTMTAALSSHCAPAGMAIGSSGAASPYNFITSPFSGFPAPFVCGGTLYTGKTGIATSYPATGGDTQTFGFTLPSAFQKADTAIAFPFELIGATVTFSTCDYWEVNGSGDTLTINEFVNAGPQFYLRIENSPPSPTATYGQIPISQSHPYLFSLAAHQTAAFGYAAVFDLSTNPPTEVCTLANAAPDGCTIQIAMRTGSGVNRGFSWGAQGSCGATGPSGTETFGPIVVDTNGVGLIQP